MSDEEEDVIIIEDGHRKEEFTIEEANDALIVQARFNLENEPANVVNIRNKEVQFGKLKNGMAYKLPKLKEDEDVGVIIEDGYRKEEFTVEDANDPTVVEARFGLDNKPSHVLNIKNKEIQFGKLKDGMMYKLCKSQEEELGIAIEDGPIKKTFTVMEANNPKIVQARFGLDNIPQNVLNIKGKPVPFGSLMDGMTYKMPKSQILIPYQKAHTQNSIVLARAVKETDPVTFVDKHSKIHTIMSICGITEYSKQKVMLAIGEVGGKNALYVVYEGSSSGEDLTAAIHSKREPKQKDTPAGGKVHAEFDERASTVPTEYIIKCAQEKRCDTIVTCGHSVGGSVSSIVALDLMEIEDTPDVCNITFGAPFFGNEVIRKHSKIEGFERKLVNYVDCSDVMPGLLYLGPTTQMIRRKSVQITDKKLVDNSIKFTRRTEKFVKFLLEKFPLDKANISDDDNPSSFISLCSDIMTGFEKSGLDDIFAPIGSYIQLKNGLSSILDTETSSEQLQERILKDPFTKMKSISEMKDGCSVDSYYKNLASSLKVDLAPRIIKLEEDFFQPRLEGKASIVWTKYEDEKWRCQLAARGQFLKSLQLSSTSTDLAGMPFKPTSRCVNVRDGKNEAMFISEETMEAPIKLGQIVHLKLVTPFGIIQVSSQIRKSSLEMDDRNISVTEPIAIILNKSVSRSLAISDMVDGEKKLDEGLKPLIDKVVDKLDPKYRNKYDELYKCTNPLSEKDDISKITEKIIESTTQKITIYYESDFKRYKQDRTRKEMGLNGKKKENKNWLDNIGIFFSWVFGKGEEVEADYVEQLNTIIHEITSSGILQTNAEKDDLLGELTKDGSTKQNPKSAFLLELLLMSYEKDREHLRHIEVLCKQLWEGLITLLVGGNVDQAQLKVFLNKNHSSYEEFISDADKITNISLQKSHHGLHGQYTYEVNEMLFSLVPQLKQEVLNILKQQEEREQADGFPSIWTTGAVVNLKGSFPRKSNEILAHLKEQSKIHVDNKIASFKNVHDIRKLYGQQCYIGFIGPQNAGKSTLLNALFSKTVKTGMRTHTQKPTKYNVSKDIFAIDFPGSDSIADQMCASLESSGHMNNFQVFVMQYNGSPNKQMIANVKMAYRLKKASGKASKTIFCLNKSSALMCEDNESFTDQYRSEYVQQIKDHIESHPYDEKEESLWKRIKEGTKEQFGSKVYEEIAQMNEELKEYTLKEIKDEDFIFTDWIDKKAHKKGIKGPEEVRKMIKEFLIKHRIRTQDNVMDI